MRRVRQALGSAIDLTRRITENLSPTLLDNVGLFAALRWQLQNACAKTTITCTEDLPASEPPLSSGAAIALFRSSQEALIVGLGRQHVTALHLVGIIDDRALALRLTGNGETLSNKATDIANLMLESIRVRVRTLGGAVSVESPSSGGLSVAISVPTANVVGRN
jgi:signal transduction histidine kinase